MLRISDEQMMAAVADLAPESFTVLEVQPDREQQMRVRFGIIGEPGTFAVRLPLPSAPRLKPWLYDIPEDAGDAASMLSVFLMEEVETGCAHWAVTIVEGPDRVFVLDPYGFRPVDQTRHRQLTKSAGPTGWNGWIQEQDDPAATPGGRRWERLAAAPFTYPEVGATAGVLPAGYRHVDVGRRLGDGAERFRDAVDRLMTWDMHRRAGLLVNTDRPTVNMAQLAVLEIFLGPWPIEAPVRVVDIITEPTVRGFAYGTLRGHPEAGEERFLIHHDPDGAVRATITAFSRPARWYTRLGAPLSRHLQDKTTSRYLDALMA